jgi:hypothetical protein
MNPPPLPRQSAAMDPSQERNPWKRLATVLGVGVSLGGTAELEMQGQPGFSGAGGVALGSLLGVSVLIWLYLELRDQVAARRGQTLSRRWKLAALVVHPAMWPVYFIGSFVFASIAYAWWSDRSAGG